MLVVVVIVVFSIVCAEMAVIPNTDAATTIASKAIVTFFITDLL